MQDDNGNTGVNARFSTDRCRNIHSHQHMDTYLLALSAQGKSVGAAIFSQERTPYPH